MGVSFTLRGLNTQLSLIRKAGYPIHVAQDICGSYYLNLDMSASLFDNIFWFKSTNPDLVDTPNINVILNTPNLWNTSQNIYDKWTNSSSTASMTWNSVLKTGFKLRAEELGGYLLTTQELISYINSNHNNSILTALMNGENPVDSTNTAFPGSAGKRYVVTYNPTEDEFKYVHIYNGSSSPLTITDHHGGIDSNNGRQVALIFKSGYKIDNNFSVTQYHDVAYYVDSSNWPDISYSHGLITNPDAGVPGAKADIDTYFVDRYLRFIGPAWLAKNITGGYNNSDLFENEDSLQRQFVNFNGNFYRYIRFVVTSLVDASFGDPNASSYTTTVSAGSKRGFIGFEDFKFYENNTQIQVSDISDITYSSRYQDATYQEESLADSSFSHLLDDSSGTFWISKERKDNNILLYEASDPSINDISHSNIGVYSRKYSGSAATSYTLQLKDNDNNPQTQTISGEWLQFEFKNNVSFNKIDFRPVGDHTPDIDIDGNSTSFLGTIPRSMAVLTSIDGTTWEVQNEYDNLDISAGVNEFTGNTNYRSLYHPNIKREITKVLDASGGSSSNPLTNADTGFSNISRDILKNMLDSDDPATVQRVHNMIKNSHIDASNNGVATSDIDPWIPIEFKDGDKMEFSLVYGTSNITDASNVALNSSGNRLGTNVVEDQDYYVRIHMK